MDDGERLKLRNEVIDEMLAVATPDQKAMIERTQKEVGKIILRNGDDHMASLVEITKWMTHNLIDIQTNMLEELCEVQNVLTPSTS